MNKYVWLVLVVLLTSITSTGLFTGGYQRSDDLSSSTCLGCLGLDPVTHTGFRYETRESHPDFVLEALDQNVVFLHYITDVCPACDEMEPVVEDIEERYPQLNYFHINLDHAEGEERDSVFVYDIKGDGKDITGVPMFVIMTKNRDDKGLMRPYFKVLYGIHSREEMVSDIETALDLYPGNEMFTSMEDLSVDKRCTHRQDVGHALLDRYNDGEVYLVSYVTKAVGVLEGDSTSLEKYQERDRDVDHPSAEFKIGEEPQIGVRTGKRGLL